MKATHQSKLGTHEDVIAWQFSHTNPIPVWVALKFHRISGKEWTAFTNIGPIKVKPGDWAIIVQNRILILTDNEFNECFQPLP